MVANTFREGRILVSPALAYCCGCRLWQARKIQSRCTFVVTNVGQVQDDGKKLILRVNQKWVTPTYPLRWPQFPRMRCGTSCLPNWTTDIETNIKSNSEYRVGSHHKSTYLVAMGELATIKQFYHHHNRPPCYHYHYIHLYSPTRNLSFSNQTHSNFQNSTETSDWKGT
jgi:hypothetical protein